MISRFRELIAKLYAQDKVATLFVAASLLVGGIFMLLIPPLFGFDETTHFKTIVYWTNPHNSPQSKTVPMVKSVALDENIVKLEAQVNKDQLVHKGEHGAYVPHSYKWLYLKGPTNKLEITDLSGGAIYSPLAYAHQIISVGVARIMGLPLLLQIYVGRLANLILYIGLMYFAIRSISVAKWSLFGLGLLPMSMFQASTMNIDAPILAICAVLTALVVRSRYEKRAFKRFELVLVLGCIATLLLSKSSYAPLAGIALLLSSSAFGSVRRKRVILAGSYAIVLALLGLWTMYAGSFSSNLGAVFRPGYDVSSVRQLDMVLEQPLWIMGATLNTLAASGGQLFQGMIGVFDAQFVAMPILLSVPLFILVIAGIFIRGARPGKSIAHAVRLVSFSAIGLMILSLIASFAALYLSYTPVKSVLVDGLQGRYFLPYMAFLPLVFLGSSTMIRVKNPVKVYVLTFTLSYTYVIGDMIIRNYIRYY